jgi:hypothetical protein
LAGCATIKYNPKTGQVEYNRFGDQKVDGFSVVIDPCTGLISASLEKQESMGDLGENITSAIKQAFELGVKAGSGGALP